MFGGYGPDIDHYLHGVGEFFWDSVSKCAPFSVFKLLSVTYKLFNIVFSCWLTGWKHGTVCSFIKTVWMILELTLWYHIWQLV